MLCGLPAPSPSGSAASRTACPLNCHHPPLSKCDAHCAALCPPHPLDVWPHGICRRRSSSRHPPCALASRLRRDPTCPWPPPQSLPSAPLSGFPTIRPDSTSSALPPRTAHHPCPCRSPPFMLSVLP